MVKNFKGSYRVTILRISFFVYAFFILIRLFYIQIIKNKEYGAKASEQHVSSTTLVAKRGDILSSDGYPLASTKLSYLVYGEPKKIKEAKNYAKLLAPILWDGEESTDSAKIAEKTEEIKTLESSLQDKLSQDLYWISLKNKVSETKRKEIEELGLKNIGFEQELIRFYPENTLASHVLGFIAASENEEEQGYFGLEGYFDGDLKGKSGKIIEERGASGSAILFGGYKKVPPKDGRNIELTLNREIQFLVEQKLKDGVEKYGAEKGSVIILNPLTGDVVAMANYPSFNPSKYYEESDESKKIRILKDNVAIVETYEPGSIMKPLTVASAIDLGLVNPDTTFEDNGPIQYSGHTIDNWDGKHHSKQTITQLLEKSNNIGAAIVGTKVGRENLYTYFKKFGLGDITGITLEGEQTGALRSPKEWEDIDLATASFGQGISATALQMVTAFSVFDNGGVLIKPRVVSRIYDDKRVIELPVEQKRRVISLQTANTITKMLVSAVDNGEAKFFNIKGYSVAGKTGTAQIPVNGKYDPNETNATFVGFLPNASSNKKFVMIVRLEKPTPHIYAAETAVPLWMSILKDLVLLYKIPPDRL